MPAKPRPKRDYAAEYARRQQIAREKGYGSYYKRRVAGTEPGTQERARARGHRGLRDFLRELREDDLLVLATPVGNIERDDKGRFVRVDKMVIPASGGEPRTYTLRRLSPARMRKLIEQEESRGAIFSPAPSLDQRRLITDVVNADADDEES